MKLDKDFKNNVLKRREVVVVNEYDSNPGIARSLSDVAQHFKKEENCVVIKRIGSGFGSKQFFIEALVYDDVDSLKRFEPVKKEKKK